MKKTIKLRTQYTKGMGFYIGYQNTTFVILVPFMLLEVEFVPNIQEKLS